MSYVVSALPDYVNQNARPLLKRSLFSAKTAKIINLQPGVKGQASLNIIDDNSTFQVDSCGFNAIDSTTLTQRIITVGKIKVDKKWCPIDLEGKYTEVDLKAGAMQTAIPFEQVWSELQADVIAAQLETAIWQGDTGSGNANLNKFDGFIKLFNAAGGLVITGTTGSVTTSNAVDTMNSVYSAIPTSILAKPDVRILCGFDIYRTFTQALTKANLYNYVADVASDFETILPGTNIKIVALNGLNGTNVIVAAQLSNLTLGVDLEKDSADYKMWYSQDNEEVRMTVKFRAGVQFGFPSQIVYFH